MYYTLPIKDRLSLMKDYRKAYPKMGYSEMVEHFNEGIKKFDGGGKLNEINNNKQYVNTNPEKSFMMSGKVPAINQDNLPNTQKRFAGAVPEKFIEPDNSPLELLSAPQKLLTQAFTGKYQTPAEAMDIKNPYGAFVVDLITDPTNLLGLGIAKNVSKGFKVVDKLADGSNAAKKIYNSKDIVLHNKKTGERFVNNIDDIEENKRVLEIAKKREASGLDRILDKNHPDYYSGNNIVGLNKVEEITEKVRIGKTKGISFAVSNDVSNIINNKTKEGKTFTSNTNKLEGLNKFGNSLTKQVATNKQAEVDKIKAKEATAKKAAEEKAKAKKRYIPEDRQWSF